MCARALICRLVQERASLTDKIGNGNLHKVRSEFLDASIAFIASLHHQPNTHIHSSLLSVLTGTALKMPCVQPHTSSSAFSAFVSTCLAAPEPLI